jgi:hypothetical protein
MLPLAPGPDEKGVPTTPRECVEEVRAYRMAEIFAIGYFDAPYIDKKAIEKKVAVRAKDCEARFANQKIAGKQIDALAQLAVLGGNDQQGRDLFAKRLAEPNISVREKALALEAAVVSFADHDRADRGPIAEEYMKQLDALPKAEVLEQSSHAHMVLGNMYRLLEKTPEQVKHQYDAIAIAKNGTQQERYNLLLQGMISNFGDLVEQYVGLPDAKEKIQAAADLLTKPVNPDVFMVKDGFEKAVKRAWMLGRVAPAIQANHWFNRDAPPNGTLDPKGSVPHLVQFTMFG